MDNTDVTIKIDITSVKTHTNINIVERTTPVYEIELELMKKKNTTKKEYFETFMKEIENVLKILEQTNYVIDDNEKNNVLTKYCDSFKLERNKITNLDIMQAFSLEVQHILDQLPNKYASNR